LSEESCFSPFPGNPGWSMYCWGDRSVRNLPLLQTILFSCFFLHTTVVPRLWSGCAGQLTQVQPAFFFQKRTLEFIAACFLSCFLFPLARGGSRSPPLCPCQEKVLHIGCDYGEFTPALADPVPPLFYSLLFSFPHHRGGRIHFFLS